MVRLPLYFFGILSSYSLLLGSYLCYSPWRDLVCQLLFSNRKGSATKVGSALSLPCTRQSLSLNASSARDHYESKIFGPSLKFHWIVLNSFQEENKNCRVYTRRDREEKGRGWSSITLTGHRVCSTREDWQWSEASWSGPWGWRNEFAFSLNFTCLNGDRAQKKLSQLQCLQWGKWYFNWSHPMYREELSIYSAN